MNISQESLALHEQLHGKIALSPKAPLRDRHDLSLQYTPGVGAVSQAIAADPARVWSLTNRRNMVAVVSDGSAVLGLGNIGPEAAIPVMEGKAVLFKTFADIDAFPICLATQDTDEIVRIVQALEPNFGGINLEDISAPRCFEIEERLRATLSIPVFHDDQHGTAIVVLAGVLNALRVVGKQIADVRIALSGAGAAGTAVANMLLSAGARHITVADRKGILSAARTDLNNDKRALQKKTNPENKNGSLADALVGADLFIGVSSPSIVTADMVRSMNSDPIVIAMANPVPEIMPDVAHAAGARIVATGRSDFPNQINNVLAFPGVFRGALDAHADAITEKMKLAAAYALAACVPDPTADCIIPDAFDGRVTGAVAEAVKASL